MNNNFYFNINSNPIKSLDEERLSKTTKSLYKKMNKLLRTKIEDKLNVKFDSEENFKEFIKNNIAIVNRNNKYCDWYYITKTCCVYLFNTLPEPQIKYITHNQSNSLTAKLEAHGSPNAFGLSAVACLQLYY